MPTEKLKNWRFLCFCCSFKTSTETLKKLERAVQKYREHADKKTRGLSGDFVLELDGRTRVGRAIIAIDKQEKGRGSFSCFFRKNRRKKATQNDMSTSSVLLRLLRSTVIRDQTVCAVFSQKITEAAVPFPQAEFKIPGVGDLKMSGVTFDIAKSPVGLEGIAVELLEREARISVRLMPKPDIRLTRKMLTQIASRISRAVLPIGS